jgi:azurin
MYQHLLVSLAIAAAPFTAAMTQTPSTQKPAPPSTQKPAAGQAAAKGARTIEIVGTDDMKFSVTTITAKPGEQLRVRLTSKGSMPKIAMAHNFVLLQKGVSQVKFVTAGASARATDFIPPDMKAQVIAATALAGAGETVEISFKAPTAPGEYPFVCTFPGHFQAGMRGTLTVK